MNFRRGGYPDEGMHGLAAALKDGDSFGVPAQEVVLLHEALIKNFNAWIHFQCTQIAITGFFGLAVLAPIIAEIFKHAQQTAALPLPVTDSHRNVMVAIKKGTLVKIQHPISGSHYSGGITCSDALAHIREQAFECPTIHPAIIRIEG